MKRTITLYAKPDIRIVETIEIFNKATNDILKVGFDTHTWNKLKLHHATYYPIRKKYKLPASLTTTARDSASDMLKREKGKRLPVKRKYSSIRYNMRTFSFDPHKSIVSLSSIHGRVKMPVTIPQYFHKYLDWKIQSATVSFDGGRLIIRIQAEIDSPTIIANRDSQVLGVDTGIYNHAVLSNNKFFNSKQIRAVKSRYQHNRMVLQAKGTRSAKRKLKKLAGREKRFMANVNHCIAKKIVQQPYDVIALETLGIKRQKRLGHNFNKMLGNWSFGQLQQFIDYKAENLGKLIIYIDPRFTSQKCSKCGHIYKPNRKRHDYKCRNCGFQIHADLNASRNISMLGIAELGRLSVNEPIVADQVVSFSEHQSPPVTSPS